MSASLVVRVTPRAGRDAIDGWTGDGMLIVRLAVAPAEGKANDALVRLIARACSVPPSHVIITRGATARIKQLRIDGIDDDEMRTRLTAK